MKDLNTKNGSPREKRIKLPPSPHSSSSPPSPFSSSPIRALKASNDSQSSSASDSSLEGGDAEGTAAEDEGMDSFKLKEQPLDWCTIRAYRHSDRKEVLSLLKSGINDMLPISLYVAMYIRFLSASGWVFRCVVFATFNALFISTASSLALFTGAVIKDALIISLSCALVFIHFLQIEQMRLNDQFSEEKQFALSLRLSRNLEEESSIVLVVHEPKRGAKKANKVKKSSHKKNPETEVLKVIGVMCCWHHQSTAFITSLHVKANRRRRKVASSLFKCIEEYYKSIHCTQIQIHLPHIDFTLQSWCNQANLKFSGVIPPSPSPQLNTPNTYQCVSYNPLHSCLFSFLIPLAARPYEMWRYAKSINT